MPESLNVLEKLKTRGNLPAMPQVLLQLIDACHEEEIDLHLIGKLVAKDSALAGKILQLANSAFIGARSAFIDIQQAVIYLGANTIKNIAISVSVQQVFRNVRGNGSLAIDRFWYHSYSCAVLAEKIAQAVGSTGKAEAYLAGLLHDLGKLILWVAFKRDYAKLLDSTAETCGTDFLTKEKLKLDVDHCEAGAWLAESWRLPSFFSDAIRFHHHPVTSLHEALPLVRVVHLANLLSHNSDPELCRNIAKRFFGLNKSQLDVIIKEGNEQLEEVLQELGIKSPSTSLKKTKDTDEATSQSSATLIDKVEEFAGITGALANLLHADDVHEVHRVTTQAIRILFNEPDVLILEYDAKKKELSGRALTEGSALHETLQVRFQPDIQKTCLPAISLQNRSVTFFCEDGKPEEANLLDRQLLHYLDSVDLACVPMLYRDSIVGVIVIGLDKGACLPLDNSRKQLQLIADQAAASLFHHHLQEKHAQRVVEKQLDAATLVARKIVHEINNPLAIVRNYLKVLSHKLEQEDGTQEELQIMDQEFERIGQITNQLSELTQHAAPSDSAPIDLNQCVQETVQLFSLSLDPESDIRVDFFPKEDINDVIADRNKLRQILLNLLGNGVDALQGQGNVAVQIDQEDDSVSIAVSDNGPGIDEKIMEKLFTPGATTKGDGHTGLGLSITQKLVMDLGGTIDVTRKGDTTTFTIHLPA